MSRIIVKSIPKEVTEKELRDHFSQKGEITDVKIMRNKSGESRKFAFIGFKSEEQALNSVNYFHNTYLRTCKIQVEPAKIQGDPLLELKKKKISGSKDIKIESNTKESKIKTLLELAKLTSTKNKFDAVSQKYAENEKIENPNDLLNPDKLDPKRLYLRNLAFEVTDEDIRETFQKFGDITEVNVPKDYRSGLSLGYAYVSFATVESTVLALSELDKTIFQGRILHITPAKEKQEKEKIEVINKGSDYKTKKHEKLKENYDDETNWNYLFMNQNSVIESISRKLGISKSELMSKDNANLAVQVAAMETTVINETKEWLSGQGINLDILKGKRKGCFRSKNVLIIKNISPNTDKDKLESLFSRYGMMVRFLLSPSNTLGIAEFVDAKHASNCMKKMAYYEIDNLPLYLEFAPEGIIKNTKSSNENKNNNMEINLIESEGKIIFINNLNFITKEKSIIKLFTDKGFKPEKVKIITHLKEGNILSSGYGFAEFNSVEIANKIVRSMQGALLDGHSLKLNIAKSTEKKKLIGNKRKAETELNDYEFEGDNVENTKILIKNLAFEADKEEIRNLFKTYGEVKTVRLPQKLDGSHRGFGFIDFVSAEEAKTAFKSLQNSHFYGRKIVLEWAKKDKDLDELRQETERKVKAASINTHRKQIKTEFKN